jgi:tetratricopeptide (TPR) repeat protein
MRAWIFALVLALSGGSVALAQQAASMNADQAYVRAVAYMQAEFAKMRSEGADTKARLVAAESELKRLRDQSKSNNEGATTALSAFAAGDGEKGVDTLLKQAAEKAKASGDDFKRAGALAFAVDTGRAIVAFENAVRLAPNDMDAAQQLEWLYERVGRKDEALALSRVLTNSSEPDTHARGLIGQCSVHRQRSAFADAETACRKALDFSVQNKLSDREADAANALGAIAKARGDYAGAKTYYERAYATAVATANKAGQAVFMANLSQLARREGDLKTAESYSRKALALDEELGLAENKAQTLVDLGNIMMTSKDYAAAEGFFTQGLALAEKLDSKSTQVVATGALGQLATYRGDYAAAESYALRALKLDEELGWEDDKAISLSDLGEIALRRGETQKACRYYRDSVSTFERIGAGASQGAAYARQNVAKVCAP